VRFLSIYKAVERNAPPSQQEMEVMAKLIAEGMKAGWLISTESCLPSKLGARVRKAQGAISVTNGPFSESKEEAVELARDFLNYVGDGECELRQLYEAPPCQ
jgi:hypothetical protein